MTLGLGALVAVAATLAGAVFLLRRNVYSERQAATENRWRTDPVPRLGGVAMLAGLLLGAGVLLVAGRVDALAVWGFLLAAVVCAAVGIWDDIHRLRPLHKLMGQITATAILILTGTAVEIVGVEPLQTVLTFFWVIGVTNSFNLLDNMDGLAAGVGLVATVVLGAHAGLAGSEQAVAVAVLLAGVLLGFLPLNLPLRRRARLFMGDGGSQLIGFGIAWLALASSASQASSAAVAIAVPLLVLAVPILDTILVAVTRALQGRPVHEGGRDHTSHRLVFYGLSERRTVLLLIGTSAAVGFSSLLYVEYDSFAMVIVGVGLTLAVLMHFGLFVAQVEAQPAGTAPTRDPLKAFSSEMHRPQMKRVLEALVDLLLIVVAYYLAYVLRYEELPGEANTRRIAESLPIVVLARYAGLFGFGLYRRVWRYAGLRDVGAVLMAAAASEALAVTAIAVILGFEGYSRTVFMIDALLFFVLVASSRLAERAMGEWLASQRDRAAAQRVLVVGAGDSGHGLLRDLHRRGRHLVVGWVDDDPAKWGRRSRGIAVLGGHGDIDDILQRHRPEVVYVTIPDAPAERLLRIERACQAAGVRYALVRGYTEALGVSPSERPT